MKIKFNRKNLKLLLLVIIIEAVISLLSFSIIVTLYGIVVAVLGYLIILIGLFLLNLPMLFMSKKHGIIYAIALPIVLIIILAMIA